MSDVELVHHALAGDMGAVERLYARYARFVRNSALSCGCTLDDAEDILHDLFQLLVEGRKWRLRPELLPDDGTLHRYLSVVVRRMAFDRRRNRGLGTGGKLDDVEQILEAAPVWPLHTENPEDRALRMERIERLRWALGTLTNRQRKIATLRFIDCLSAAEIAERLGVTPTSVFSQMYLIREALRPRLACAYQIPENARYGFLKFGSFKGQPADRPRDERNVRYRARRRRQRTVADRHQVTTRGARPA